MRPKGNTLQTEFRAVTESDLVREQMVHDCVRENLEVWQSRGWVPDLRVEPGGPPRYQGLDLIRSRGWIFWHHAFTPRQIMVAALVRARLTGRTALGFGTLLNSNSKMCRWNSSMAKFAETFDNQALNTLYNYACQSFRYASRFFSDRYSCSPVTGRSTIACVAAESIAANADMFITDPPYGDAVMYHEITEFFIAWAFGRIHRRSLLTGFGTAAAPSPSKAKTRISAAEWWPLTSG